MMSRPSWWRRCAGSALSDTVIITYGLLADPVEWQIVVLPAFACALGAEPAACCGFACFFAGALCCCFAGAFSFFAGARRCRAQPPCCSAGASCGAACPGACCPSCFLTWPGASPDRPGEPSDPPPLS